MKTDLKGCFLLLIFGFGLFSCDAQNSPEGNQETSNPAVVAVEAAREVAEQAELAAGSEFSLVHAGGENVVFSGIPDHLSSAPVEFDYASYNGGIKYLLMKNCAACHGAFPPTTSKCQNFDVRSFEDYNERCGVSSVLSSLVARLKAGTMPPQPMQISDAEKKLIISWAEAGGAATLNGAAPSVSVRITGLVPQQVFNHVDHDVVEVGFELVGTDAAAVQIHGLLRSSPEVNFTAVNLVDGLFKLNVGDLAAGARYEFKVEVRDAEGEVLATDKVEPFGIAAKAKITYEGDLKGLNIVSAASCSCHTSNFNPNFQWDAWTNAAGTGVGDPGMKEKIVNSIAVSKLMPPTGSLPQNLQDTAMLWLWMGAHKE